MTVGAPRKGHRHLLQITDKKLRCIDEGSTGGSVSPSGRPRNESASAPTAAACARGARLRCGRGAAPSSSTSSRRVRHSSLAVLHGGRQFDVGLRQRTHQYYPRRRLMPEESTTQAGSEAAEGPRPSGRPVGAAPRGGQPAARGQQSAAALRGASAPPPAARPRPRSARPLHSCQGAAAARRRFPVPAAGGCGEAR